MHNQILAAPATIKEKGVIASCVLLISAFFLFFNLGHYALWDDEAETALGAKGVLATGDTTAVIGHNIQARRSGITLIKLHDRVTPPFPTYLTALSFKLFGISAYAARFPMALCGFFTVALILGSMWKRSLDRGTWLLAWIAIICNVSFFLYFRQARYYGVALFLAVLIGALYLNWSPTRLHSFFVSLVSALLFMSHPIVCVQVATVIGLDFLLFNRSEKILSLKTLPFFLIPALILIGSTLMVWNPLATETASYFEAMTLADRLRLLGWYVRDLNRAEFFVGGLILLAPLAYMRSKTLWIPRTLTALAAVVVVTVLVTYQPVKVTSVADIRYAILVIPLGMAIGVMCIRDLFGNAIWAALAVAIVVFGSNLLNAAIFNHLAIRSTPLKFVHELCAPPSEPYTPVSQWIRTNVPYGASVWVLPDYMAYPLMFHSPNAVYAWQIDNTKDPQFSDLPRINFKGEIPPQYVIAFGPIVTDVVQLLRNWGARGVQYEPVAFIDTYWRDLYRPELFWRHFDSVTNYNRTVEAIYIFRLRAGLPGEH